MIVPAASLLALAAQCADPSPPVSGFLIEEAVDQWVTFSDGEATTAIARWPRDPAGPCGWPLIVFTHGLNGSRYSVSGVASEFTAAGYFTVAYDVRGHDTATGVHTLWGQRERFDVAEIIEWVEATFGPLVDTDRIGLGGVSQGGVMSFSAAAFSGQPMESNPWRTGVYPDIDAIVVENLATGFAEIFAPQGIGVHANLGIAFLASSEVRYDPAILASLNAAIVAGDPAPWSALVSDPTRDVGPLASNITSAVLAMGAWDDFWFPPSQLLGRMSQIPATTPHRLYIGAVGHSTPSNEEQRARRNLWRRQWFDWRLKDIQNGVGDGEWLVYAETPADVATYLDVQSLWTHRESAQWPLPDRHDYPLYLSAGARLSPVPPKFPEAADTLVQDVLGPFTGQDLLATQFRLPLIEPVIPRSHFEWDSPELPSPLRFAGSPKAHLHLSSNDTTWQLGVSLWDVDELGEARFVTSSSYFRHFHPGGAVEAIVALEPNVYEFPAGHRIRLRVENMHVHEPPISAFLRYAPEVNPFTVDVQHSPGAVSALLLPVDAGVPVAFGWSQANSQNCSPIVAASGEPRMASSDPFIVGATQVLNNKDGVFLYSFGRKKKVIGGGSLWLASPLVRRGLAPSGGNPPPDDCSGAFTYDFGARMRSGLDPNLVVGERIYCQFWSRDPGASGGTNLTHGLEFTILP